MEDMMTLGASSWWLLIVCVLLVAVYCLEFGSRCNYQIQKEQAYERQR